MNLFDIFMNGFERPYTFLLIIPILIILIYFFKKDFVGLFLGEVQESKRKKLRIFVFISRIIVIILLLIALASPYTENTKSIAGDPKVKILVDNSTSMDLFNLGLVQNLKINLEKKIPVEVYVISEGEKSPLGEAIVSSMRPNDNLLLITDGNNNGDLDLGDAALQASSLNSTISAVNIKADKYEASIAVYGNEKTTAGAENTFNVVIQKTENKAVHVIVEVDGAQVINKVTSEPVIEFKKTFSDGYHKIIAKVEGEDYFTNNGIFYKTVKVVPKPKVLLLGEAGALSYLFSPLYDITISSELPESLISYNSIIVDDMNVEIMNPYFNKLVDFVSDGNGLFVIGGDNSYDSGNYSGSKFEQLLPVYVASAGRKRGEANIVFVMDISGSTGESFGEYSKVDYEKAQAIGMLKDLSLIHNVGFVAFNNIAYKIAEIKKLLEQTDLEDKVSRLQFGGGTEMVQGLNAGIEMLQNKGGSKNIIILSDGKTGSKEKVSSAVRYATSQGINVYTVGVGRDTDTKFMRSLANIGNGVYFEPDSTQQLKLIFGDTESSGNKRVFPLIVFNKDHFITAGLKLNGNLYGFNKVVPKTAAKLLVTTDVGDPVVAVWRFGLGRIASLATDYNTYGFELLNRDNSGLLTRTSNWAIGDPERNNLKFIDISDGRIGDFVNIIVKSDVQPSSSNIALYKFDENLYRGSIFVNSTGFNQVLNSYFAVNYKQEYEDIGINPELEDMVYSTGGMMFDANDTGNIVEFVKQKSRREIIVHKSYSWIFLLIAMILYFIDIAVRRLVNYRVI